MDVERPDWTEDEEEEALVEKESTRIGTESLLLTDEADELSAIIHSADTPDNRRYFPAAAVATVAAHELSAEGELERDLLLGGTADEEEGELGQPEVTAVDGASLYNHTDTFDTTTNPFVTRLLESLHTTAFSPSVFSHKDTPDMDSPERDQRPFRWSIDHMAVLNPVDIDEFAIAQHSDQVDSATEARLHSAIDLFWASQAQVAPSPEWTADGSGIVKKKLIETPDSAMASTAAKRRPPFGLLQQQARAGRTVDRSPLVRGASLMRTSSLYPPAKHKESQTLLTFPPALDLEALLGGCFQYHEAEDGEGEAEEAAFEANLSMNTLRRKLFSCDENNSAPFASPEHRQDSAYLSRDIGSSTPPLHSDGDEEYSAHDNDDIAFDDGYSGRKRSCGGRLIATPDISPIKNLHAI